MFVPSRNFKWSASLPFFELPRLEEKPLHLAAVSPIAPMSRRGLSVRSARAWKQFAIANVYLFLRVLIYFKF
jgi:hypothetical protein